MAFAATTSVPVEKSLGEIVTLVKKAGAQRVAQMEDVGELAIQFFLNERMLRFRVKLPTLEDMPLHDNANFRYSEIPAATRQKKAEAACRQKARALLLVIKAKLESVESNVESFDEAFLANVVMSDGMTVYERISEPLALEYQSGKPVPMLLEAKNG
jgi:hypothetical protein